MLVSNGWNVGFNEFHIDFSRPFKEQIFELNEDLLQLSKQHYILDIGWYPEADPDGSIKTVVIKDHDWMMPVIQFIDRSYPEFADHLKYIAETDPESINK